MQTALYESWEPRSEVEADYRDRLESRLDIVEEVAAMYVRRLRRREEEEHRREVLPLPAPRRRRLLVPPRPVEDEEEDDLTFLRDHPVVIADAAHMPAPAGYLHDEPYWTIADIQAIIDRRNPEHPPVGHAGHPIVVSDDDSSSSSAMSDTDDDEAGDGDESPPPPLYDSE